MERPHTVLTSTFMHPTLKHFLINMLEATFVIPSIVRLFSYRKSHTNLLLGYRRFAYFYIGSAYASTFLDDRFFSYLSNYKEAPARQPLLLQFRRFVSLFVGLRSGPTRLTPASFGASGCVSAAMMFFFLSRECLWQKILVPLLILASDLYPLLYGTKDENIHHGVHLGGFIYGCLIWFIVQSFFPSLYSGATRHSSIRFS